MGRIVRSPYIHRSRIRENAERSPMEGSRENLEVARLSKPRGVRLGRTLEMSITLA
jgi:hypothetical protein